MIHQRRQKEMINEFRLQYNKKKQKEVRDKHRIEETMVSLWRRMTKTRS